MLNYPVLLMNGSTIKAMRSDSRLRRKHIFSSGQLIQLSFAITDRWECDKYSLSKYILSKQLSRNAQNIAQERRYNSISRSIGARVIRLLPRASSPLVERTLVERCESVVLSAST